MDFVRSDNVLYPQIWHTFQRTDSEGNVKKFTVQDLSEDRSYEVVELMTEYFMKEESLAKALGLINCKKSYELGRFLWIKIIQDKLSLICTLDDGTTANGQPPKIAGVLLGTVKCKTSKLNEIEEIKGSQLYKSFSISTEIMNSCDIYGKYGVDKFCISVGLIVVPAFRGLNIAVELLKARSKLTSEVGLNLCVSPFSSVAAQKSAAKAGYEELLEVPFDEISKKHNIPLPGLAGLSTKVMAIYNESA